MIVHVAASAQVEMVFIAVSIAIIYGERTNMLDDAKTDTELATLPPPVSDREQEEKSSDVTMLTESLTDSEI